MESSIIRILGNHIQRRLSTSPKSLIWRHKGSLSFSVSANLHSENAGNIVKSDRDMNLSPFKGVAITDYLFQDLGKWSNAVSMECTLTGRKYTHGEVYNYSRGFGTALQQMGYGKGDTLAIAIPNMPEYPIVTFGAWFSKLTVTLVNPLYTPFEIGKQLADCEAKCIVTLGLFLPYILQAKSAYPVLASMKVIVIGEPQEGCHTFAEMLRVDSSSAKLASSSDPDLNTEEDVILLPYSSGTTGPPKGCMLTHSNLVLNCAQTNATINAHQFTNGNPQEVGLGLLPFFHIMAFQALGLINFTIGGKVLCLPRFEPDTFIECLKNNQLSIMHIVAPLFQFIISHPELSKEEFSECKTIFTGACPTSRILIDKFLEKASKFVLIQEGYGMTELSPLSHMILPDSENSRLSSVGPPIPNTLVKVVCPETGKALGPKEKGEIWIKGPQVMKGYFKNEEATKDTITSDGWLKTGDIGLYEEDKHFFIVDRLKELIKVKGIQVSPSELEAELRMHPAVADVAVVGIPHKTLGEAARAFVVSKSTVSETEIADFLKDKLSSHKQLSGGVQFVQEIPKAPSGKILRRELKTMYLEGQGTA
ncbi:4-coumarate--CoA ligase 1 [Orchesella cincta]|uniref:4-coumarate--CoA ligase 1 n=1 Tax=Orchesella cincta TaxID=48709 RepID=A0A1D2NHQ7_ORCCI|nr:4-coumarate--CoA ligase 1 [Orchesella cincta]